MGICVYTRSLCDIPGKNIFLEKHQTNRYQELTSSQYKNKDNNEERKLSLVSKKHLNNLIGGAPSSKRLHKRSITFYKSKKVNTTRMIYRAKTKMEPKNESLYIKKNTQPYDKHPSKNDSMNSKEITNLRRLTIPEQVPSNIIKSILIEQEINVVIIGEKNVGKTTFALKVLGKLFEKVYVPSIGLETKNKKTKFNNTNYNLKLFVTPGEESYKKDYTHLYQSAHFILLFYDVSMESSFCKAKDILLREIHKYKQIFDCKLIDVILVGNKSDLRKTNIQCTEVQSFCEEQNCDNFEISVKTGVGMKNLLNQLFIKVQRNQLMFEAD